MLAMAIGAHRRFTDTLAGGQSMNAFGVQACHSFVALPAGLRDLVPVDLGERVGGGLNIVAAVAMAVQ